MDPEDQKDSEGEVGQAEESEEAESEIVALHTPDREEGITCTPRKINFDGGKVVIMLTSSDISQFVPFVALQGDPCVLNIRAAQGELAFTETEPDFDLDAIPTELPLDPEVEAVCPECNAPAEYTGIVDSETGKRQYVCTREGCETMLYVVPPDGVGETDKTKLKGDD